MRVGYDAKRIFHNGSGLGNYSRDLVRILAQSFPKNEYFLYNPKKATLNRWKFFANTFEKQPKGIWRWLHSVWRQGPVVQQLKKDHVDIFHGLSGELPKGLMIPGVVTVHDLIFMRFPALYKAVDVYIHKRKVIHAVNSATKVVAISEQTKADLIAFIGVDAAKIEVIYQGCHPVFKQKLSLPEKGEIARKHQLPKKYVLYVGTLEDRKNALSIAKALKETAYPMVFVGRVKAHGEKLKAFVAENNMQDRVLFIEHISVEDLAGIYQNAHVFCYPSFFEGFGIPIIEALYSGIPVVTTAGGCFQEAGGASSIYVNPTDEKALQNAVEQLYAETEEKRQARIEKGYAHVERFDDATLAKKWNNLYKSLLS